MAQRAIVNPILEKIHVCACIKIKIQIYIYVYMRIDEFFVWTFIFQSSLVSHTYNYHYTIEKKTPKITTTKKKNYFISNLHFFLY